MNLIKTRVDLIRLGKYIFYLFFEHRLNFCIGIIVNDAVFIIKQEKKIELCVIFLKRLDHKKHNKPHQ